MHDITVGIYPRERFSQSERCISALLSHTTVPFKLLVVDCNMPRKYRQQIDRAIRGVGDARVLEVDHYVLPNESRNLLMESADTPYVCLLESDVLHENDGVRYMLETAKATGAAVVRPTIYQRRGVVHFDRWLGPVVDAPEGSGQKLRIVPPTEPAEYELDDRPRSVSWTEFHCLLLHKPSLQRVFPLDEALSEPEHIDFSFRLRAAAAPIVYEPRAVVRLCVPPPVERDERDFFRFRWDLETARSSHRRFRERWSVQYAGIEDWISTAYARESWLAYAGLRWRNWLSELVPWVRPPS